MHKIFGVVLFLVASSSMALEVKLTEGKISLADFITACGQVANSLPSTTVQKNVPGLVVAINGTKYEVRYFSFEDTTKSLPKGTTFKEYVKKNHLMEVKSRATDPLPGIHFEAFDFRQVQLNDNVYFSMALRELKK